MNLPEKIGSWAKKVINKASVLQKPLTVISAVYIFLVVLLIVTWYASWLWRTLITKEPDLNSLLQFINTVIGPTFLACISFIAGLFIDTNQDEIPDSLEKGVNTNNGTANTTIPVAAKIAAITKSVESDQQPTHPAK